jgi:hypothetical protein
MKKNSVLIIILFFFIQSSFSQTLLKGKVISEVLNLDGIQVINLTNQRSTSTEKGGFFSILAKPTDTLLVSAMQIKGVQLILKSADFSENLFFVRLQPQINQLDEVTIKNYSEINAVSLGIIPKGVKTYTPAQRRLKAAATPDESLNAGGMAGGSVGLDPLINMISGRTAMLKKELEVENKERLLVRLSNIYEDAFFVDQLKIPSDYIKGFKIYAIDNVRLVNAIKAKNMTLTSFLIGELAEKYKKMTFPERNAILAK